MLMLQRAMRPALLLILCTLPGCRGASDNPARLDQGRGSASDQAWRLVAETTIGSADGEGPAAFSRIVDVEFDPMGRVWVADGLENEIRVFQPDGRYVRTIGRKGAGPGEFTLLGGMDWAPDGTLWVMDVGNARYSVWDTAGALVDTHPRRTNVASVPWPGGLDAKGALYDQGASPRSGDDTERIVRYGADLQPRDTFLIPAFDRPMFEIVNVQGNTRNVSQINVPYAGLQEWRLDREGNVWIGVTDRYRIERHRFDGTVDRVVERAAQGRPVSRADRRQALEFLGDFRRRGGRIDESRIPDTYPVFNDFFFDDDSALWVMLANGPGEPSQLDVYDATGRYLGGVTSATQIDVSPAPAVRDGQMAAVVTDDDGVPSVVVMRIEKPGH
jgi:hypothetical protein